MMLCKDCDTSTTKSPAPAEPQQQKAKTKKSKKKKFSALLAEATKGTPETAEQHRQKIARHLGGGTFSKVDKI